MKKFKIRAVYKGYALDEKGDLELRLTAKGFDSNVIRAVGKELKEVGELTCEFAKYSPKRTLNANSYLWVICDSIGKVVNKTAEELYQGYIRDVGVFDIVAVQDKAYERFKSVWESQGLGRQVVIHEQKKGYKNVRTYYGSSEYDKDEFRRLVDYIVQDAQSIGIDTRTPNEIMEMRRICKD